MTSIGLPYRDVAVEGELGLPAWLLQPRQANGRWAVLVHSRCPPDARCLRALALLRLELCLVITYRNDPTSAGTGRAVQPRPQRVATSRRTSPGGAAAAAGASGVVLGGWSMGGGSSCRRSSRRPRVDFVDAVFLDALVVDWVDVLAHHARLHHIPPPRPPARWSWAAARPGISSASTTPSMWP